MSLMIIASTNRMASRVLLFLSSSSSSKDKPLFSPSIMSFSVKLKDKSPCWQEPLTHACELLPQRYFFPLMVISGPTTCKGMYQLPYHSCPGMLRIVQRQKLLKDRRTEVWLLLACGEIGSSHPG